MQKIPPRLSHLLLVLSESPGPVSVSELAGLCGVSRRTIFREIENIDGMLKPFSLHVGTKVGEGVYLAGEPASIGRLREYLRKQSAAGALPISRHERRVLLLLDLLTSYEPRKLFYYADSFGISEATVSHDLDVLESRLENFGLLLVRRPGHGVFVKGGEAVVRAAICAAVAGAGADSRLAAAPEYPRADILRGVRQMVEGRFSHHLAWTTDDSRDTLYLYMAVTVERVISRNSIETPPAEPSPARYLPMADFFANSLELRFSITLNEHERGNLATVLSSLRKAGNAADALSAVSSDYYLKQLAYQMIEHFDPELAPFLKLDDRLVDGLALHMQSALVRIKNRVVLNDPLLTEISRSFPDILEKSKKALTALEDIAHDIPESEASFLATHFGAGVMRIRSQSVRRVKLGVVCLGGIGTSYFLASQLGGHFSAQADIEICGLEDIEDWSRYDLCVTTIPLSDVPIPVVQVHTLLEESDIAAVGGMLENLHAPECHAGRDSPARPLPGLCRENAAALLAAADLLTYFDVVIIEEDCDFDHLARLAGYRFGGLPEDGRRIYEDIIRRESLSTQVVPELELILLHARTLGVKTPVFSIIVPEDGRFTSPALQGARCCCVMLAPADAGRDTLNLMGRISSALLEDHGFLQAVKNGDKARVYRSLEDNFRDYLVTSVVF